MPGKQYIVHLTEDERTELFGLITKGITSARLIFRMTVGAELSLTRPAGKRTMWSVQYDRGVMNEVATVIEIAELTSSDTLKLPPGVAGRFRPSDRFVVWAEGDALYLKRITPRSVAEVVAEAPEDEPMSLDEINDIVHEVRRQRKAG